MSSEVTCTLFIVHCTLYNVQPSFLYFHTSEVKVKMAAAAENNSSLAFKCLDLCQALASHGQEFTFSVTVGSSFSFSMDAMESSKVVHQIGKKSSPSNSEEVKPFNVKEKHKAQPAASPVLNDSRQQDSACVVVPLLGILYVRGIKIDFHRLFLKNVVVGFLTPFVVWKS